MHSLRVGQLVWCYHPHLKVNESRKLKYPWVGPFEIIALTERNTAKLRTLDLKMVRRPVAVDRLRPVYDPANRPHAAPEPGLDQDFTLNEDEVPDTEFVRQLAQKSPPKATRKRARPAAPTAPAPVQPPAVSTEDDNLSLIHI